MKKSDEDDYKYAVKEFEKCFEVPDVFDSGKVKTLSYFTEEGLRAFSDSLDIILNLFCNYAEDAGFGEVEEKKADITKNIIYQDEYQLLVKAE